MIELVASEGSLAAKLATLFVVVGQMSYEVEALEQDAREEGRQGGYALGHALGQATGYGEGLKAAADAAAASVEAQQDTTRALILATSGQQPS